MACSSLNDVDDCLESEHEFDSKSQSEAKNKPEATTNTNGDAESDAEIDHNKKVDSTEPMQAELKYLDRKYSERHQWYYAETVEDQALPEQLDWWEKYALCVTRYMSQDGMKVQKVVVQINSQHLKDLLKEAVGSYPGVSLDTKDITLTQPCRILYHYFDEIRKHGKKFEAGSEAATHFQVLLNHIHEEFGETIKEAANLREQGMMSYQHLWTIFKPQTVAFAHQIGQIQAYRVLDTQYVCGTRPSLVVKTQYVGYDGKQFGTLNDAVAIPAYLGALAIEKLDAVPRQFYPAIIATEKRLIARGRVFESYAGTHFAEHNAIAMEHVYNADRDEHDIVRVHIDGQVVVDCATYYRLNPDLAEFITPFEEEKIYFSQNDNDSDEHDNQCGHDSDSNSETKRGSALLPETKSEPKPLTEEQCLLAGSLVRGFSFTHKRWVDMLVDNLVPIEWNDHCFDQLVLEKRQKKLVQALVTEHVSNGSEFDDIIKGKGKGLVLVLHGPPGVGKTLTAECVAEHCKRPLYVVSSGDLGTDSSILDERLTKILDMASTWHAVLLIDEADVFLERRSLHDMERNALVSIFLRVLEYYQGILFLTSNRVDTFDDAFKSRIHIPLKYTGLDVSSRKQIWQNFLSKVDGVFDDAALDKLAIHDLNGRQIKGIVRTASSLARYDEKKLDLETLGQVIEIHMDFERDLAGSVK